MTLSRDDGIVVVGRSRKGNGQMDFQSVPASLQDRLGTKGTSDLVRLFDTARAEWSDDVLNLSLERFERRLVQEIAGLRVEIARGQATLREELAQESATLRTEIATLRTGLKGDMQEGFASLRQEIAKDRFELLKWSFYFWVGQFFAVAALMTAMLRGLGTAR